MSKHFFIGIDGGATSCIARIRDTDGNLLGEGEGGPANIHSDLPLAKASIRAATKSAFDRCRSGRAKSETRACGAWFGGRGPENRVGWPDLPRLRTLPQTNWKPTHTSPGSERIKAAMVGLPYLEPVLADLPSSVAGASPLPDGALRCPTRPAAKGWAGKRSGVRFGPMTAGPRSPHSPPPILTRFNWDPAEIVSFAAKASSADYARFAPLIFRYAAAEDPLAVTLVKEAADAAVSIIDTLRAAGAPNVSLIGGLAEPLLSWLPPRLSGFITPPQSDPVDGAILMARRAFFNLNSVMRRAG